jgi:hypothetical protein
MPDTLGLIGFQTVFFLLLQQDRKYKPVYILAYLPQLYINIRTINKSGRVSGNSMDHFQVAI